MLGTMMRWAPRLAAATGLGTGIFRAGYNRSYKKRKYPFANVGQVRRMPTYTSQRRTRTFLPHHVSKKVELKEKNITIAATRPTMDITHHLINGIATGTGADQRLGNRIELQRITGRMQWAGPANGTQQQCRVMIVYDTQPNGIAVTAAELLATPGDPILSLRDTTRPGRMEVIYDKTFLIGQKFYWTAGTGDGVTHVLQDDKMMKFSIPLKSRHPHYDGTGAIIDDINVGALYLVVWADLASGGDPSTHPTYEACLRLKYFDA